MANLKIYKKGNKKSNPSESNSYASVKAPSTSSSFLSLNAPISSDKTFSVKDVPLTERNASVIDRWELQTPADDETEPLDSKHILTDMCAFCASKSKAVKATHICLDCSQYGRYFCHECLDAHNTFKEGHTIKSLSVKGESRENEMKELIKRIKLIESRVSAFPNKTESGRTYAHGFENVRYVETLSIEKALCQLENSLFADDGILNRLQDMGDIVCLFQRSKQTDTVNQYKKLYETEWANAFKMYKRHKELDELEIIVLLYDILQVVLELCFKWSKRKKSDQQWRFSLAKKISEPSMLPLANAETEQKSSTSHELEKLTKLLMFAAMEDDKPKMVKICLDEVKIRKREATDMQVRALDQYVEQCVNVCLLMLVREPAMVFGQIPNKMKTFHKSRFKVYKTSGPFIDFVVLPTLYLPENGTVLCKGVAQGCTKSLFELHEMVNKAFNFLEAEQY